MMRQKNNIFVLFLLFTLTSCGFSTGMYNDIIQAQDLIANQKFSEAVKIYEEILEKKPSKTVEIKINYQLGEIYSIYLLNYQKSLKYFEKIVKKSHEPKWQVDALRRMGEIYFSETKDFLKSSEIYNILKNFKPSLDQNDFYHYRFALSVLKNKNYRLARKEFQEIIDRKESKFELQAYYYIGMAHFYEKNYKESIKSWLEYLKREKRQDKITDTKFLIANAYESADELKKAYNIYYSILGEYPNNEIIQSRLESLYKRRVARRR